MDLLPWLLTHSLSYVVRIPLAIQTRVTCRHVLSGRNAHTREKLKVHWLASATWYMHYMRKLLTLRFCFFENALHESFFLAYVSS